MEMEVEVEMEMDVGLTLEAWQATPSRRRHTPWMVDALSPEVRARIKGQDKRPG